MDSESFVVVDRIGPAFVLAGPTPFSVASLLTAAVDVDGARVPAHVMRAKAVNLASENFIFARNVAAEAGASVARVFFVGARADDELALVREIVPGVRMPALIDALAAARGTFPVVASLAIARQIALVLRPLSGFVTSPDLVVAWDGGVRVDARVGKHLFLEDIPYMLPEQIGGFPFRPSAHAHVVAHALYALVEGEHPWVHEGQGDMDRVGAVHHGERRPLTRPDIPPEVRVLITQCLQPQQELRWSLDDVMRALDDAIAASGGAPQSFINGLLVEAFPQQHQLETEWLEQLQLAVLDDIEPSASWDPL